MVRVLGLGFGLRSGELSVNSKVTKYKPQPETQTFLPPQKKNLNPVLLLSLERGVVPWHRNFAHRHGPSRKMVIYCLITRARPLPSSVCPHVGA